MIKEEMMNALARSAALACCCSLAILAGQSIAAAPSAGNFASVLADPLRPPEDVARDADRKPAELLAFAGVRKGMTIVELAPGGGYFTRILTGAVGPSGHVYAITAKPSQGLQDLAQKRPNLSIAGGAPGTIPVTVKADLVWTTLNYHDFKNNKLPTGDVAQSYNAEAFKVLKPGGTYLIVDHEAAAGAGATQTSTLHQSKTRSFGRKSRRPGSSWKRRAICSAIPPTITA